MLKAEERARQVWRELADDAGDFSGRYTGKLIAKYADALRAHAHAALEAAAKEIRDFQDMVGWQKYDSRNQLIQDIEDKVRALKEEE